MSTAAFLDLYDALDVIGNGSFGIIRKVRHKENGQIYARKELNFERMSERDRKQIVAEVNILKDLHHDHIVRYHDRHVDRESGILYILMEFCGGGDLSNIILQAIKQNRPIPEDTIWNYFMQLLLALHHCHHPNGHSRSGTAPPSHLVPWPADSDKRPQILHRDLKPDNVFLDSSNSVKLGDFGLSKALAQASFANTYVGTPYYMSPELMQEKAYDSKSDIWSLGCLIYELCALKPPFHEAKTHAELSIFIRNGRIPPLPKGYSQALSSVIKAMLNLNPAMRPSAAQLLQHERLELALKVSETEKMLATVKAHKATLLTKERDLAVRESSLTARESALTTLVAQKDAEIATLAQTLSQHQDHVRAREDELRLRVMKREEEVAEAMKRREEEILEAVRRREAELAEAWTQREKEIRAEMQEWLARREDELLQRESLQGVREERLNGRHKTPLEEVKNLLPRRTEELETPINRRVSTDCAPSAMKGVVLTSTGEPLHTPTPAELAQLFVGSPRLGLNFAKIFDQDSDREIDGHPDTLTQHSDTESPPPSPSDRKAPSEMSSSSNSMVRARAGKRRPHTTRSRRASSLKPATSSSSLPPPSSEPIASSSCHERHQSLSATSARPPDYDFSDESNLPSPFLKRIVVGEEDNLPSPFLKRAEREPPPPPAARKRASHGNLLRTGTVATSVRSKTSTSTRVKPSAAESSAGRPSIASARKASEEARKALARV